MVQKSFGKIILPNIALLRRKGSLRCPDCNVWMIPYRCEQIIVDQCPQCSGVWFDSRELAIFQKSLRKFDLEQVEILYHPTEPEIPYLSACPRCSQVLFELTYSYNTKVKIKRCESCKGIWLPIHEILNLIELVKIGQALAPHVKGMAKELIKLQKEREAFAKIKKTSDQFRKPIPGWRPFFLTQFFVNILPLDTNNPSPRVTPILTISIIFLNTFLFFLMRMISKLIMEVYEGFALIPIKILALKNLYSLFTSIFMHNGFFHLFGNMLFLWIFGKHVENRLGFAKFIAFYVLCGLVANLIYVCFNLDSPLPALGASGAISGILACYLYLFPQTTVKTLIVYTIVEFPTWFYIGFWFFMQFGFMWIYWRITSFGGAWSAHVGGFLFGLLLIWHMDKNSFLSFLP